MDENVIVITFSEDSRAYEALARLKAFAADDDEETDSVTVERVQPKLRELRERLRHLVHR